MNQTVRELHKKRSKMWDESIENHKKYINHKTGIFDEKLTQMRNCPVCESNNELEIFYKEGGRYVKCLECNMVYLNPVFKDAALTDYYQTNHTLQSEIVETDTDNFYTTLYNQGLNSLTDKEKKISTILDIGCSSGAFLDIAKARDIKTYGVELNRSEFLFAKKKGHTMYNDTLQEISFGEKFDAITLWDVFEHIKDGVSYLNQLKKILSKDGLIFLQIPSSDSLAAKILREQCNMFDGLEHVNLYGVETIKLLADRCALEVLSLKTVISEIGVINNYLNYENPYFGKTKNREFIPNLIDEQLLHQTLQGYKIQVVLKVKT